MLEDDEDGHSLPLTATATDHATTYNTTHHRTAPHRTPHHIVSRPPGPSLHLPYMVGRGCPGDEVKFTIVFVQQRAQGTKVAETARRRRAREMRFVMVVDG